MDRTSESISDVFSDVNSSKGEKFIVLEFTSGYAFRQLVEYGALINNELPIYCNKTSISTSKANDTRTIITFNMILPYNLTKYVFNEKYVNQQGENSFHVINMNFQEARKYIKNISKTKSVRLYQYSKDPNNTYLQYFGTNDGDEEEICIPNVMYQLTSYNVEEVNRRDTTNPNVTISLDVFCEKIKSVQKLKHSKVIFRVFPKGVHIYCLDNKNTLIRTIPWGEYYPKNVDNKPAEAFDIILTDTFMKALCQTSTFHSDGIIRIYCSQDNLVRLEIPVSCFGTNITYLTIPQKE